MSRSTKAGEVTVLLDRMNTGDRAAANEVVDILLPELLRIARSIRRSTAKRCGAQPSLQSAELINEAYLRLFGNRPTPIENRIHFLGAAAKAMRSAVVDYARRKKAQKRGGKAKSLPLDAIVASYEERSLDLIALDEALASLEEADPELSRIVELRIFAGLTMDQIASSLGRPKRNIERRWSAATSWLGLALGKEA